jgi:DivIVA domain-containing protein
MCAGVEERLTNASRMSSGGDSRSLFVVQRAFRRVRRGYDPDEVDRHLQLVSEWFSQGRGGRTAREAEQQLAAREEALAAAEADARRDAEGARVEADATLEGARLRAAAAIESAEREAQRIVGAAHAEAERIVAATRAEAERIAAAARAEGERLLETMRGEAEAQAGAHRAELDRELRVYEDRRRREADRAVQSARAGRLRGG